MPISIAIDGTAGSGKGYLASELAKRLNFVHLDTGAIYRTIAYACYINNINYYNEKEVVKTLQTNNIEIVFSNQLQINKLNGINLGNKIRDAKISEISSIVSTFLPIREFATNLQHKISETSNVIIEGRDIGTVVLPNADYKFYLDASPEIRAKRRMLQNNIDENKFEEILNNILERDNRDKTREVSPLKMAEDAIYIDNSNLTKEEVLEKVLSYIKK